MSDKDISPAGGFYRPEFDPNYVPPTIPPPTRGPDRGPETSFAKDPSLVKKRQTFLRGLQVLNRHLAQLTDIFTNPVRPDISGADAVTYVNYVEETHQAMLVFGQVLLSRERAFKSWASASVAGASVDLPPMSAPTPDLDPLVEGLKEFLEPWVVQRDEDTAVTGDDVAKSTVSVANLWQAYNEHLRRSGGDAITVYALGRRMKKAGYVSRVGRIEDGDLCRVYTGLRWPTGD